MLLPAVSEPLVLLPWLTRRDAFPTGRIIELTSGAGEDSAGDQLEVRFHNPRRSSASPPPPLLLPLPLPLSPSSPAAYPPEWVLLLLPSSGGGLGGCRPPAGVDGGFIVDISGGGMGGVSGIARVLVVAKSVVFVTDSGGETGSVEWFNRDFGSRGPAEPAVFASKLVAEKVGRGRPLLPLPLLLPLCTLFRCRGGEVVVLFMRVR